MVSLPSLSKYCSQLRAHSLNVFSGYVTKEVQRKPQFTFLAHGKVNGIHNIKIPEDRSLSVCRPCGDCMARLLSRRGPEEKMDLIHNGVL